MVSSVLGLTRSFSLMWMMTTVRPRSGRSDPWAPPASDSSGSGGRGAADSWDSSSTSRSGSSAGGVAMWGESHTTMSPTGPGTGPDDDTLGGFTVLGLTGSSGAPLPPPPPGRPPSPAVPQQRRPLDFHRPGGKMAEE